MIFRVFFFILMATFSSHLFATPQVPEILVYNGEKYPMYVLPLYGYFKKYPERRPTVIILGSGLRRGYVATFEIKNDELFLKEIKVMLPLEEKMSINQSVMQLENIIHELKRSAPEMRWKSVLPEVLAGQSALKIDWLTGLLIVGEGNKGRCVSSFPGGFVANYESYILVSIKNGNFEKAFRMSCPEFNEFQRWCESGGCKPRKQD